MLNLLRAANLLAANLLAANLLAACLGLAACALETPPPSTGYLPPDAFGDTVIGEDPAIAATNEATNAFARPASLQGHPAEAALAIACLDAMAGQFSTSGRWLAMDISAKQQMLEARDQVRAVLGVPTAADSQSVIDQLITASHALSRGDQPAALAALSGPDFTKPPAATLLVLTHFPRVPVANVATINASQYLFPQDGGGFAQ